MILFFGPPGSGKSVQGQLLIDHNGWQWLSTGQLFRDSNDPEVLERLKTGELIDDELTNKVLTAALAAIGPEAQIVLDGYPRNPGQAAWLEQTLPHYKRKIEAVIVFEVPKEELIKRLSGRGREEDAAEVIEKRLRIFHDQTKPVLDFYKRHGVAVCPVDGVGKVGVVYERIQTAIKSCLPA